MALTEYTYTKSVNPRVLSDEIAADGGIIIALDHIDTDDTALSVWMADVLPGGEETALDAVVSAHANPADPSAGNTIAGSGAPDDYVGSDGDCCIDAVELKIYQKVSGAWDGGKELSVPGAASATLSSWTLDNGDLYYADFAHNLGSTEIAIFLYDSGTTKQVEAEDIRVTDTNTIRVWVRGNAESLVCNVVTGRGPMGPAGVQGPAGGGATDVDSLTDADTTTVAPVSGDALVFDGTNWVPGKKTVRNGHTWAISGEVNVPAGDVDFVIPFFVSLAPGQTAKVVKARYVINGGTNCNVKVQKNGVDVTGFTNITVTTTAAETDPADVALADNDKLALVVNSVSGAPTNLTFTLFVENSF